MTLDDLAQALAAAGFVGVEVADGVVYARLSAADSEFTARPVADGIELTLCCAMRAAAWQMADWAAQHPDAPLDIWQGETRLRQVLFAAAPAFDRWSEMAEAFLQTSTRWRKAQRDRGEGW